MNLNRRFLIIATLIVGALIQLVIWGNIVTNKDIILLGLMFVETVLVVLLGIYVFKNKKK
jgi:hypothetical protein